MIFEVRGKVAVNRWALVVRDCRPVYMYLMSLHKPTRSESSDSHTKLANSRSLSEAFIVPNGLVLRFEVACHIGNTGVVIFLEVFVGD